MEKTLLFFLYKNRSSTKSAGFSLPIVLAVVAICSLFVLTYLYMVRAELGTTKNYMGGLQSRYLALAAADAAFADSGFLSKMRVSASAGSSCSTSFSLDVSGKTYYYDFSNGWNSGSGAYNFVGSCSGVKAAGIAYGLGRYALVCVSSFSGTGIVSGIEVLNYSGNESISLSDAVRKGYLARNLNGCQPSSVASWSLTKESTFSSASPLSNNIGTSLSGSYLVSGPWQPVVSGGTVNGNAVIFVSGGVSSGGLSAANINFNGNFVIITEGDATIDSGCNFSNALLIVGGNTDISSGAAISGAVLCFGNAVINGKLNFTSGLFSAFSGYSALKDYLFSIGEVQPVSW